MIDLHKHQFKRKRKALVRGFKSKYEVNVVFVLVNCIVSTNKKLFVKIFKAIKSFTDQ